MRQATEDDFRLFNKELQNYRFVSRVYNTLYSEKSKQDISPNRLLMNLCLLFANEEDSPLFNRIKTISVTGSLGDGFLISMYDFYKFLNEVVFKKCIRHK